MSKVNITHQTLFDKKVSSDKDRLQFYKDALGALISGDIPFLLGGAYAYECYTEVHRDTKDLDIFVKLVDCERTLELLQKGGYCTEMTYHWLAKAYKGRWFIDIIFSSANGICKVTDEWFEHAVIDSGNAFDLTIRLMPVEEMIWSKAFIMEKERFDGGDINHLIRSHGVTLNWKRLLKLFGPYWRVLLSHLIMFGFVYPYEHSRCIPSWVIEELTSRLLKEQREINTGSRKKVCNGTLVSRAQYLKDIMDWDYIDGRLEYLTKDDIQKWTAEILGTKEEASSSSSPEPKTSEHVEQVEKSDKFKERELTKDINA